jgi:hypothetical protein
VRRVTPFLHIRETDCVADDAVIVKPVSASKFPANKEKNREIVVFSPFSMNSGLKTFVLSGIYTKIPYPDEQGINSRLQGINLASRLPSGTFLPLARNDLRRRSVSRGVIVATRPLLFAPTTA